MSALFLGLDVGTQGTKGLVIDAEARAVVARAASAYGLIEGLPAGHAEQHPDTWWSAVVEVVRALVQQLGPREGELRALGVSGQQHGLVALDRAGAVIRPAKLWCDTSCDAEARELSAQLGRPIPPGFTAPKILWLKRRETERFARLATVLLPHDWINLRLTGRACMEAGDASGTGLLDIARRTFDPDAMRAIDERLADRMPPLVAPDQPIGEVLPEVARELGLPAGMRVSPGGGDNMMSALGSGATRPGIVTVSLGTSGTVFTHSDRPVIDPEGWIAPFCDSTGGWLPLLCVMNAGGVLEEVREHARAPNDHAALTRAAQGVEPGCGGVLFMPYLMGERAPNLPGASGALLGMRHGSLDPAVLYRAAIEGVSLNLGWGVERMRALGIRVDAVRLVGGGARNPLWAQVLADVLDAPVHVLAETESAALGAALQAAWCGSREKGSANGPTTDIDALAQTWSSGAIDTCAPQPMCVSVYRGMQDRLRASVQRLYEGG